MKVLKILNIYESLTTLADKDLDLNTAFTIAKNIQSLTVPKRIIEEKRDKLIQTYAEKDKDGKIRQNKDNTIIFSESNAKECDKKLTALFNEDINIELAKIQKSALADIKISPKLILGLMDILEE